MSILKPVGGDGDMVSFHCPGCDEKHIISVNRTDGPSWGWNGSTDAPTFTPSVFVRSGHFAPGQESRECWCTYEEHFGEPAPFKCKQCHSFVADGRIQFLGDCSHALAGQTVDLPQIEV